MRAGLDVIADLTARLGLPLGVLSQLVAHADAVAGASARLGLVSTGDEATVLQRHTAGSLLFAMARAPLPAERWVDLGSGGGFPGLVLAICYPQTSFTLVESSAKKAGFLEVQVIELGLQNARIAVQRGESLKETFDVGTARAVDDPQRAIPALLNLVAAGGWAVMTSPSPIGGFREVSLDLPDVDSHSRLFMMAPVNHDE